MPTETRFKRPVTGQPHGWLVVLLLIFSLACSRSLPQTIEAGSSPTVSSAVQSLTATPATALVPIAEPVWPTAGWPVSAAPGQDIDVEKLNQVLTDLESQNPGFHSLLVFRHGYLLSETYFGSYQQDTKHELYSVTKSFMATLVGIAVDKTGLDIKQSVLSFFPTRSFDNLDSRKQAMTVEDLLMMASGLDWVEGDQAYRSMYLSRDWIKAVLDLPMLTEPGAEFNYCSGCSHILSAIVEQQTGDTLEFAQRNLFAPLGITDFYWGVDVDGIAIGGWGLKLTPREMAKLGYLYLHHGAWEDQQIVPASWVTAATHQQIITEDGGGYGYQWWLLSRLGGYAALGRGGQTILVVPNLDLIIVVTSELPDHSAVFDLLEKRILPLVK